jgi:hypothetical protein
MEAPPVQINAAVGRSFPGQFHASMRGGGRVDDARLLVPP